METEPRTEPRFVMTKKHPFTRKVGEVLTERANGLTCKEIARLTGRTERTIKNELNTAINTMEIKYGVRPTPGNWIGLLVRKGAMTIEIKEGGV